MPVPHLEDATQLARRDQMVGLPFGFADELRDFLYATLKVILEGDDGLGVDRWFRFDLFGYFFLL